jgi:glutathione-regulated potassium-efflux system ancillary protein KefF
MERFLENAMYASRWLLAPVYTCGISYADRDADKIAQQKTLAREHAARLIARLNTLVE